MTTPILLVQVTAPSGAWAYADNAGRVSGLTYTWTYPGGPSSAEFKLDTPTSARIPALTQGSLMTIHHGAGIVWSGTVRTIARGAPWTVQADGIGGMATREPMPWSTGGSLDACIDTCIAAGLPWTRPSSISTSTLGSTLPLATTGLDVAMARVLAGVSKRWMLSVDGVLSAQADPTVPALIIRADNAPTLTLNDFATEVLGHYNSGIDYTVRVVNATTEARFGRVPKGVDLTAAGTMTLTQATVAAQAILDTLSPTMTIMGDFTVSPGQVVTAAGAPVSLALVTPGVMVRVQLGSWLRDALTSPLTSVDVVIGATKYDADTQLLTLSPVGRIPDPIKVMLGDTGATS